MLVHLLSHADTESWLPSRSPQVLHGSSIGGLMEAGEDSQGGTCRAPGQGGVLCTVQVDGAGVTEDDGGCLLRCLMHPTRVVAGTGG